MKIHSAVNTCYDSLLAIIYPQKCAVCGGSVESRADGIACEECWNKTKIFSDKDTLCWKCGLPSVGNVALEQREQVHCRRCEDTAFTAARACGLYEGALKASVLALKRDPYVCKRLIQLLSTAQNQQPLNNATRVIPVPLHKKRQKPRGFNQATLLATALSRTNSILLDQRSLIRTSHTERHRAGMDARDRQKTVESAFEVLCPTVIHGERVLLIDDVFTTGATVSSCSRALREAGAAEVFVLTLARPFSY
jgi:competence protein ComFC